MEKIIPTAIQFIKLGEAGEWKQQCQSDGTLRFGYHETPNSLCVEGRWEDVHDILLNIRDRQKVVATSDVRQIKTFYRAGTETVFITLWGGFLYWCLPTGQVCDTDPATLQIWFVPELLESDADLLLINGAKMGPPMKPVNFTNLVERCEGFYGKA
ncbi:TPA: hypothetical protein ACMEXM_000894 [Klebsiella variicola subsp. variicola]|uniref:hypothetical protein n=1 Tax=Klebsiella sp. GG_Kp146 TaxID=3153457 RepID=UPI002FF9F1FF